MSEGIGHCEYAVKQKAEGAVRLRRVLLVLLYVFFVLGWLAFGLVTQIFAPLLALIPLTTWMLVFFTWRYVSVEYEYVIDGGALTVSAIYGSRSRKTLFVCPLKACLLISPRTDAFASRINAEAPARVWSAVSCAEAPSYLFLWEEGGEKRLCEIEMDERMLKTVKYYNRLALTEQ